MITGCSEVLIDVLERDDAPQRLLLGSDAVRIVRMALEARLDELSKWEEVSTRTDYEASFNMKK